jgi:hypothetical protein
MKFALLNLVQEGLLDRLEGICSSWEIEGHKHEFLVSKHDPFVTTYSFVGLLWLEV